MATTSRQKAGWGAAKAVTLAVIAMPLLWIASLSFKTPAAITDPSFWPAQWTWGNYSGNPDQFDVRPAALLAIHPLGVECAARRPRL
jgi:ABC-type glycerol-3-phosphate transport system permease component